MKHNASYYSASIFSSQNITHLFTVQGYGGQNCIYNLRLKGRLWDCTFFESQYVSIQFQPLARKEVSWWIINVDKTCEEFNERTPSSLPDRQESIFRIFVTKES